MAKSAKLIYFHCTYSWGSGGGGVELCRTSISQLLTSGTMFMVHLIFWIQHLGPRPKFRMLDRSFPPSFLKISLCAYF